MTSLPSPHIDRTGVDRTGIEQTGVDQTGGDQAGVDQIDSVDATPTVSLSTQEVLARLGAAMLAADRSALRALMGDDVVALIPGRNVAAGLHRGPVAVVDALMVAPPPGVRVVGIDVTEVLVEGSRGLLIMRIQAALDADADAVVAFEVALHVQCRGALIVGVTEYAGDQYALDGLLGT